MSQQSQRQFVFHEEDEDGAKIPPIANPLANKPADAISTLAIENALRFDNKLMVFETRAIYRNGVFYSGAPSIIRMVSLNFTANGADT